MKMTGQLRGIVTATTAAAGMLLLAAPAQAQSVVFPGDTFSVDVAGFNSTGTSGFLLTPQLTTIFGTTQTFTGAGVNGQDITVSSLQTIGASTTTDTFTISTPTNFLTTATVGGVTITQLQFDLGNANSGSNTVRFLTPVTSFTATGSTIFSGGTLALTPTTTLSADGFFLSAVEGVNSGTTAISGFAVRSFTYSITYNNAVAGVPEPATWAMMLVGFGALGGALRRRRTVVARVRYV